MLNELCKNNDANTTSTNESAGDGQSAAPSPALLSPLEPYYAFSILSRFAFEATTSAAALSRCSSSILAI